MRRDQQAGDGLVSVAQPSGRRARGLSLWRRAAVNAPGPKEREAAKGWLEKAAAQNHATTMDLVWRDETQQDNGVFRERAPTCSTAPPSLGDTDTKFCALGRTLQARERPSPRTTRRGHEMVRSHRRQHAHRRDGRTGDPRIRRLRRRSARSRRRRETVSARRRKWATRSRRTGSAYLLADGRSGEEPRRGRAMAQSRATLNC